MEMFLLMGENYIGNPEVGGRCHARRVQFDLGLQPELRRKIYSALGSAGVGSTCPRFREEIALVNVLITSASRKVSLVRAFQSALSLPAVETSLP